jgi:hypothetical protein
MSRESVLSTLWGRLYQVSGMVRVTRNAVSPAALADHPWANIVELPEKVVATAKRGTKRSSKRDFQIAVEVFISGSSEEAASSELGTFVGLVRDQIFLDGDETLGGTCAIEELDSTRVYSVTGGGHIKGMGIGFKILYVG